MAEEDAAETLDVELDGLRKAGDVLTLRVVELGANPFVEQTRRLVPVIESPPSEEDAIAEFEALIEAGRDATLIQ